VTEALALALLGIALVFLNDICTHGGPLYGLLGLVACLAAVYSLPEAPGPNHSYD
jgi:hypothetical protein